MTGAEEGIIATYSLHHLDDDAKVGFLNTLLSLLKPNGKIYVGDEEIYFVYNELKEKLSGEVMFEKISHCAGIIALG